MNDIHERRFTDIILFSTLSKVYGNPREYWRQYNLCPEELRTTEISLQFLNRVAYVCSKLKYIDLAISICKREIQYINMIGNDSSETILYGLDPQMNLLRILPHFSDHSRNTAINSFHNILSEIITGELVNLDLPKYIDLNVNLIKSAMLSQQKLTEQLKSAHVVEFCKYNLKNNRKQILLEFLLNYSDQEISKNIVLSEVKIFLSDSWDKLDFIDIWKFSNLEKVLLYLQILNTSNEKGTEKYRSLFINTIEDISKLREKYSSECILTFLVGTLNRVNQHFSYGTEKTILTLVNQAHVETCVQCFIFSRKNLHPIIRNATEDPTKISQAEIEEYVLSVFSHLWDQNNTRIF